nr:MAG TPA: hypothetical protein [Caudoviricetes sp.]
MFHYKKISFQRELMFPSYFIIFIIYFSIINTFIIEKCVTSTIY